jgi:hypothetical protein
MESDTVSLNRFCTYLIQQNYAVKFVAFLSEDETAFGSSDIDGACRDAISRAPLTSSSRFSTRQNPG